MQDSPFIRERIYVNMITEISDYAIILMDTEGIIQNWNIGAERIKGYKKEEIIGQNFRLFYTEKDLKEGKPDELLKVATENGRAQDEGWRVRKDGSQFWGSITITSVHDEEGKLVGFSKVTRDLTEKRATELSQQNHALALESKNRELEQFAYIASHDLQEPLRTITTLTDMINKTYAQNWDDQGRKMMDFILKATARMRHLISGLLDYSRIGKKSPIVEVNVQEIVAEVMADLSVAIQEKRAQFDIGELPTIRAYEVELRMVFQNLIENALKFSKPDDAPKIRIHALKIGELWKFTVEDNGIGISKGFMDKIFLIFQRLHKKDKYEGTGIGLAHCWKVAELHKGTIWAESEENKGSIFYFTVNSNLKEEE